MTFTLPPIPKFLKSRTFWTVVATFVINGLQGIRPMLTPHQMLFLDAILSAATVFFHVTPSQNYNE